MSTAAEKNAQATKAVSGPPGLSGKPPAGVLATAWVIIAKDLLIEWRTRARLNALIFFSLATLLLFSFALGPDTTLLRQNAGGYLWLAMLFSSVLSLGESFRVESENLALDGIRLAPADARGIFLGKALSNALLLFFLSVVLLPVMFGLYGVSVELGPARLLLVLGLGCLAVSAPGTLYAAISGNARARDVLLPLLLFPVLVPALLGTVKATTLVFQGDAMGELGDWTKLLIAFDVIYWSLGFALFPKVVED